MSRTTLVLTVLAALAAGAAPSAADELDATGLLCTFAATSDPTREGYDVGYVDGGPLVVTGAEPGANVELVCGLQVDAWEHDGADVAVVSASGPGAATVPPTPVAYPFDPERDWDVVVCTEVRVTGSAGLRTLYWDAYAEAWSATPDVTCEYDPEYEPPPDVWIDSVVCPVFALAFLPQGDVPGIWDCPPYEY